MTELRQEDYFCETPPITGRKPNWSWNVFGNDRNGDHLMIVTSCFDPPWWRRLLTRIFLGSIWTKLD